MTSREKYRIIRKLDSGGMAEVFLGEAESLEGFSKRVAIKRILPHLVENKKFLAMFLDEARLSLRFNNANVVQTFDIGRSGNTYFVVMEYVDGANLRRIVEDFRENSRTLPLELAAFIMIEICRGLSYAHNFKDSEGSPLGIVHRDVSPPNILLSKQGEVKIVDFGLAKATSQLEKTDPGVVKGKFAYLSPEAAYTMPVDHRADIFACGIILWELLTGKRLFLGENDVQTVELVREAQVPSIRSFNPDVPPGLEAIAKKALAREPEDRYQGCDEMAEALADFLFEYGRRVTSFDLQRLVKKVTEEDDETAAHPSIIDQLIQEEMERFSSLDSDPARISEVGANDEFAGAAPLDPTGFEDPMTWAGEMGENGYYTPVPLDKNDSTWRESGRMRRESSPGGIAVQNQKRPAAAKDNGDPSLARMLEGEARLRRVPAEKPIGKIGYAVAMLAGAAVGLAVIAAAYAMGWIP